MQSPFTYELDSQKLDDAIAILETEQRFLSTVVQNQQRSERVQKPTTLIFVAAMTITIISGFHGLLSVKTTIVAAVVFFVAYYAICIAAGWREIPAVRRLRKVQKQMGLKPYKWIQFINWAESKRRLVRIYPYLVLNFIGFILVVVGVVKENIWIMDAGICVFALYVVLFTPLATRLNVEVFEDRLKNSQQLLTTLSSQRDATRGSAALVPMTNEQYKEIARIELALVSRARQKAIKQTKKEKVSIFPIQQSLAVLNGKAEMQPAVRVRVQTAIEGLSTNARPVEAVEETNGNWLLPVVGTPIQILYSISEQPRRILVQNLLMK